VKTMTASILGLVYVLSEAALAFKRRAKVGESRSADRGSLRLLWLVIFVSVWLGFNLAYWLPSADMDAAPAIRRLGVALFAAGLAIRW
jgi:hypothetical protein